MKRISYATGLGIQLSYSLLVTEDDQYSTNLAKIELILSCLDVKQQRQISRVSNDFEYLL